jgi:hypothetical protein
MYGKFAFCEVNLLVVALMLAFPMIAVVRVQMKKGDT